MNVEEYCGSMPPETSFREIWQQSIRANSELALSGDGSSFNRLIGTHQNDGMVRYSRAEAYEFLRKLDRAEEDFRVAEHLFPVSHWRAVAKRGVERVQHARGSRSDPPDIDKQWDTFHRVYQAPAILHEARTEALSAIARIRAEPYPAVLQLRTVVELLLCEIQRRRNEKWPDDDLQKRIDTAAERNWISPRVRKAMQGIRLLGNKAAHPARRAADDRPFDALHHLGDIIDWFKTWR